MRIISRVCAEFRNAHGLMIFQVTATGRNTVVDAPEEIRSDPLFGMLIEEGSVEIVKDEEQQKELEKEPMKGADATGKKKAARKEAAAQTAGTGPETEAEAGSGHAADAGAGKGKSNAKPEADEARV